MGASLENGGSIHVTEEKLADAQHLKAEANKAFKGAFRFHFTACLMARGTDHRHSQVQQDRGVMYGPTPTAIACGADRHWAQAVAGYTRAIEANPTSAILYANRAAAHIRLENYGSAIADGTQAVELDSTYVKVHFCTTILFPLS